MRWNFDREFDINRIAEIEEGFFENLHQLEVLNLGENPKLDWTAFNSARFDDLDELIRLVIDADFDCFSAQSNRLNVNSTRNDCAGEWDLKSWEDQPGQCEPDNMPFDGHFEGCDCAAGYIGERCQIERKFNLVESTPKEFFPKAYTNAPEGEYIEPDANGKYHVVVGELIIYYAHVVRFS
jgi:hypothetical protein